MIFTKRCKDSPKGRADAPERCKESPKGREESPCRREFVTRAVFGSFISHLPKIFCKTNQIGPEISLNLKIVIQPVSWHVYIRKRDNAQETGKDKAEIYSIGGIWVLQKTRAK